MIEKIMNNTMYHTYFTVTGTLTSGVQIFFFFSSRRRHTRSLRDWSSDVCSSDLAGDRVRDKHHDHGQDDPGGDRRPKIVQQGFHAASSPVAGGPILSG